MLLHSPEVASPPGLRGEIYIASFSRRPRPCQHSLSFAGWRKAAVWAAPSFYFTIELVSDTRWPLRHGTLLPAPFLLGPVPDSPFGHGPFRNDFCPLVSLCVLGNSGLDFLYEGLWPFCQGGSHPDPAQVSTSVGLAHHATVNTAAIQPTTPSVTMWPTGVYNLNAFIIQMVVGLL